MVRAGWTDPLEASYSQSTADRRWNTADFPALYCCCSVRVAIAVARDVLGYGELVLEDLAVSHRPSLVELEWEGDVADVISPDGVAAAGFPRSYPSGVEKHQTRECAARWLGLELDGVVCRSASLARIGMTDWTGSHEPWGELAIFTSRCTSQPRIVARRQGAAWLTPAS